MPKTLQTLAYDRAKAVEYAHRWALDRNPRFYNFDNYGGDCTNFASQVIYAGCGIMNYTENYGWYYSDTNNRTPAWTGVDFLYDFLVNNKSVGPYAEIVDVKEIMPGDIIQLSFQEGKRFNHSLAVVQTGKPGNFGGILVATHTDDQDNYALTNYEWVNMRCMHIVGIRN